MSSFHAASTHALIEWDGGGRRLTIFTPNYDSLLLSAMLENANFVYDGFRGGYLNVPLDRWWEPALHHLHGSVGWVQLGDGSIRKRRLADMREEGIIQAWADGHMEAGLPSVVLGDMKSTTVGRYPFAIMYEELSRCLADATLVVVGGYAFADRPINSALATFLARDRSRRLLIWRPGGERDELTERLRTYLSEQEQFLDDQVSVEHVVLPDPDAVREARRQAIDR